MQRLRSRPIRCQSTQIGHFPDGLLLSLLHLYKDNFAAMELNAAAPSNPTQGLQPHRGILRTETKILRRLLGYGDHDVEPDIGIELPSSSLKDVLFVAIDIDTFQGYEKIVADQQFHIGLSILDTRSLRNLVLAWPVMSKPASIIKSYQFIIGNSGYCQRASRKFLFGETESISVLELGPRLKALVTNRDIILVLHGANSDLKVLRNLDIDLEPIYTIDTVKAAQFPHSFLWT